MRSSTSASHLVKQRLPLETFVGDRNFVMSLARGLIVMQAFADAPRPLTIADVSRSVDIPRAAVRRLLHTLCELGYAQVEGAHFSVTPKLLRLASALA